MSELHLVVFDCDGTLVDSQFMIAESMKRAFEANGLEPLPRESVRQVVGLKLEQAIGALRPDLSRGDLKVVADSFRDTFFDLHNDPELQEPLYDGAREAVEGLSSAGYLLAVATGKSRRGLNRILETHGLEKFFTSLRTADDGPGKPNPQILDEIMAENGVNPKQTVVVGDTTFDMMLARNGGASGIGVAWGYHEPEALRSAGADMVIGHFRELPGALEELWSVETA